MKLDYFTAPWCQPCRVFGPIIESTVNRLGIRLNKVNIEATPELLPEDVMGIPTVIGYLENKEVARFTGAKSESDFFLWLVDEMGI